MWREFPILLIGSYGGGIVGGAVQVETAVKNEQFADVEAVNFVKVEVNKEFDGNILTNAEKTSPQSILLQRC